MYHYGITAAIVLAGSVAQAATFTPTFDTPAFAGTQFDVESDPAYNAFYAENFGITIMNAYLYLDSRDTFDGLGIASGTVAVAGSSSLQFGRINFLDTTDTVTLDYWSLGPATYAAYASDGSLVDQADVPAQISTLTLDGGVISYILFSSGTSAHATVSSLTYNYDGTTDGVNEDIGVPSVPLPAALPLMMSGVLALGFVARRRRQS